MPTDYSNLSSIATRSLKLRSLENEVVSMVIQTLNNAIAMNRDVSFWDHELPVPLRWADRKINLNAAGIEDEESRRAREL